MPPSPISSGSSRSSSGSGYGISNPFEKPRPDCVRTGLSVLAWPNALFHTYRSLMARLGVATTQVRLPFVVRAINQRGGVDGTFVQGGVIGGGDGDRATDSQPDKRYADGLAAWRRAVWLATVVRAVLHPFCSATQRASVYLFSPLNPLNVVPLKALCRVMGMSEWFWYNVVVALHSSVR